MKAEKQNNKTLYFLVALVVTALVITGYVRKRENHPPAPSGASQQQSQQSQPREKTPEELERERLELARRAREEDAIRHSNYVARYLNPGFEKKPNAKTLGLAIVSESGRFNHTIGPAVADRFKGQIVQTVSSLFTPEFVSDGLFNSVFSGSSRAVRELELSKSLDMLLLAREQVQYSTNDELEHVISANMQLEIVLLPVGAPDDSQTWTLSAVGAGFKPQAARALAEERLMKEISRDKRMSPDRISENSQSK